MATQFDPIAKDESLNTTEVTPRNIADVLAEELSAIEQAIAGGSGSGGHVIVNASGTDMTQRAKMQFVDAGVTDDSVNDKTKVEILQTISAESDLTNAPDGVYQGTWDESVSDVLTADMVGYGSGTVEDALDMEEAEILPVANKTQMGSKKVVKKSNRTYYINAVIIVLSGTTIQANEPIATLPFNLHGCYVIGRLDSDGSLLLMNVNQNSLIYEFGTISAGAIIRIGATVII